MISFSKILKEALKDRVLYHVTPEENLKDVQSKGLIPSFGDESQINRDITEKRVYFFEDEDTAEDALVNWLVDKFPNSEKFAILEVRIPPTIQIMEDSELAGSYYVIDRITANLIKVKDVL